MRKFDGNIQLIANPRAAQGTGIPDYIAQLRTRGSAYEAGNAWIKESKDGEFLSITLDDPDWHKPLNLAAFPRFENVDGNSRLIEYAIVWTRPKGEKVQDKVQGDH